MSADEHVPPDRMRPLLDLLVSRGFFEQGRRFYTERVEAPVAPPPSGAAHGPPARSMARHLSIEASANDDEYYHYVIRTHPWGETARAELEAIRAGLDGRAAELVSSLLSQL